MGFVNDVLGIITRNSVVLYTSVSITISIILERYSNRDKT
jgi:hypothetical protein